MELSDYEDEDDLSDESCHLEETSELSAHFKGRIKNFRILGQYGFIGADLPKRFNQDKDVFFKFNSVKNLRYSF